MRSLHTRERRQRSAASRIPSRLCSEMSLLSLCLVQNQKYARNGHLTGALKWFLSKGPRWCGLFGTNNSCVMRSESQRPALCDRRAKAPRPAGKCSLPHPIMPLPTKHIQYVNPPATASVSSYFKSGELRDRARGEPNDSLIGEIKIKTNKKINEFDFFYSKHMSFSTVFLQGRRFLLLDFGYRSGPKCPIM